eukprot:9470073-Pyramimonas_sp.AAC.2
MAAAISDIAQVRTPLETTSEHFGTSSRHRIYSRGHDRPIRCRKHGYIPTVDQSENVLGRCCRESFAAAKRSNPDQP